MTVGPREPLLVVDDLKTYFFTRQGVVKAVDGVSFSIREGETLGLVGESGCGKSMTALSILRLVPEPAGRIVGGKILFQGEDLLQKSESQMRQYRGSRISMILQDPLTSLNPIFTIGDQVAGPIKYHRRGSDSRNVRDKVVDVLQRVRIPAAEKRLKDYPHLFSGGMRQRVVGAMAIACEPRLLIADEPTTALDVTIEAQFLRLLKQIQQESGIALILITHNLGIVARICRRVAVMYAGRIVESGNVHRIFENPAHPYTKGLMDSVPRLGEKKQRLVAIPGQPPDMSTLPPGCSFWPRCEYTQEICRQEYPPETRVGEDGYVRCWLAKEQKQT